MKRIAVVVRDRQSEAFRMSVGLTVLDDQVDIFIMKPVKDDPRTREELNGALDLGLKFYSLIHDNDNRFEVLRLDEFAGKLLEYDHVIPY
jgi:hypothetical protein